MIEVFGAICMTSAATDAPKVPARRQILGITLYLLEIAVVALIYVGLANIAALFAVLNAIGTPLWPPSGIREADINRFAVAGPEIDCGAKAIKPGDLCLTDDGEVARP
jgi:Flp pilus assembly protein TadB